MMNTPATTRPFNPISMPIDILRIPVNQYSGFRWIDQNTWETKVFPTYRKAIESGMWNISPNYIENQQKSINDWWQQPTQPIPQQTSADKYLQNMIDTTKQKIIPTQTT